MESNMLIKGDNAKALEYLRDDCGLRGKVSLVYIDPPFATGDVFSIDDDGRVATVSRSASGRLDYRH